MMDFISLLTLGISAFIATNIDDILILMMFFSESSSSGFPPRQVVLGQFVGMGMLVAISALGSLIPLLIPLQLIGLLGLVPIAIGIKKLIQVIRKRDKNDDDGDGDNNAKAPMQTPMGKNSTNNNSKSYLSFLTVRL